MGSRSSGRLLFLSRKISLPLPPQLLLPPGRLRLLLVLRLLLQSNPVSALAAFGYCTRCQQQHSIPTTDAAKRHARLLRETLESTGRLDFDSVSNNNTDDEYDYDHDGVIIKVGRDDPLLNVSLLHETRGKMFGVLVCQKDRRRDDGHHQGDNHDPNDDSDNGGSDIVVLKAFAGKIRSYGWTLDGYVDPIVVPEAIPRFVQLRDEVSRVTVEMEACFLTDNANDNDSNSDRDKLNTNNNANAINATAKDEWTLLKDCRSQLSREALEVFRNELSVTNFRGDSALLQDVFLPPPSSKTTSSSMPPRGRAKRKRARQMPVGVGECCATKLIAAAAAQNLRPTGIAEFFVGKSDRRRVDGDDDTLFYDACPDRCQKVLGFMLCGCNDIDIGLDDNVDDDA